MADEVKNFLRSLLMPTADECRRVDWRPAADIYCTRRGWLVKFDLAGVRPQEIELIARGQRLTVRGVRRDCTLEEGHRHHSLEISYNRFERALELPCNVEAARITTDSRDGMLLVFEEQARRELPPGVAAGLAWTEAGGDVLYIEAALLPERKGLTLTGQLGNVMQESAKTAQSYIWSRAAELGIDPQAVKHSGAHIHVPAGAIPKDGPSAGVTMAIALASLYAGAPARSDTAMTGEITLTGLVMPVGGIKEKVLAARRAGIRRLILPKQNERDLDDLPEPVRQVLEILFAQRIEDVFAAAVPELSLRLKSPEPPYRAAGEKGRMVAKGECG